MSLTHDTLGRSALALFVLAAAALGGAAGYAAGVSRPVGSASNAVLDGTAPIDAGALAELARVRAEMGATWLANVARDDGSYLYIYYPESDRYELEDTNEVRHAGTTYSLFSAYGVSRDESVLDAAEGGIQYIDETSLTIPGRPGRAYIHETRMKLGGQALALVALLERRRVLEDDSQDALIQDLADFMMAMELPDEPGRYHQSYIVETDELSLDPPSNYYPGESLLAYVRLAQQFPDDGYLEYARRAAHYLIYEKDGSIPAAGEVPREDHWLTMALSELYRLDERPEYREVAYLQAERMLANQHRSDDLPMRIGGSMRTGPINYTSTATKAEALVAAWALARYADDEAAERRYADASYRNLQFQLRVQYTEDNTQLFPRPEAAIGAWGKDAVDPWIRIDFVQHNISGLLGLWAMTTEGDLPIADPLD